MTNFSLVIGVLALASMALLLIRRRRQKANPARTRSDFPDSEPDSFAEFETQMRLAFGFALLNSGYGSTQVWVTLRRAIKEALLHGSR